MFIEELNLSSNLPEMVNGNYATDGGHLILNDEERIEIINLTQE